MEQSLRTRVVFSSLRTQAIQIHNSLRFAWQMAGRVLLLVTVLIPLLITLACIVHCHTITDPLLSSSKHSSLLSSHGIYICHTPGQHNHGTLPPVGADMLRLLTTVAPVVAATLLLPLLAYSEVEAYPLLQKMSRSVAPEPPPPRCA